MAYFDDQLEQGERVIYRASVRWAAYAPGLVLFVVLMMVRQLFSLAGTKFALTNKRVLGKTGVMRKKAISLAYKDIEVVQVRQGLCGKLFAYGTLTVRDKTGKKLICKGIAWPQEAQQLIEEEVEMAVLGRKLSHIEMPK